MATFRDWRRAANARWASASSASAQLRSNIIDVPTIGDQVLAEALGGEGSADERYDLLVRGSALRYQALVAAGVDPGAALLDLSDRTGGVNLDDHARAKVCATQVLAYARTKALAKTNARTKAKAKAKAKAKIIAKAKAAPKVLAKPTTRSEGMALAKARAKTGAKASAKAKNTVKPKVILKRPASSR